LNASENVFNYEVNYNNGGKLFFQCYAKKINNGYSVFYGYAYNTDVFTQVPGGDYNCSFYDIMLEILKVLNEKTFVNNTSNGYCY